MPWFVDVELVNPQTGDKVGKRLDLTINVDVESPESWASIVHALEIAIRDIGRRAKEVEARHVKSPS